MKKQPNSEEKDLASSLAESIYNNRLSNDDLMKALGKLSCVNRKKELKGGGKDTSHSSIETVGIWKIDFEDGKKIFVRDPKFSNEFVYWADIPRIAAKSDKFRIVILGESVARGWPLDPGYNPATSLKQIFDKVGFDVDIIDLARTNCGISDLKKLLSECLELEPDALVIFGGNNWIINCQQKFNDKHDLIEEVVEKIAKNDYEALRDSIQDIITQEITDLFEQLGSISKEKNLPVFVINPEFNLRDWHSNDLEKLPLFNADRISDWYQTCFVAKEALRKRDLETAGLLSDHLIEIFPSNPQGYELKAECKLAAGRNEEAKKYYQAAVETKMYQASSPGITVSMQEQIRTMSKLHDLSLVDLPLVFEDHLNGQIPGREMFLDYCHLTVEGINIGMYHLALKVYSTVCRTEMPFPLADIIHFGHENVNDSKSHFLVAIHNAHWGQDFEIIYYHCKKALSYYDISEYMLAYVKAMNSTCPGRLNKDFGLLVESGIFSTYILLTLQSDGAETFDLTLSSAIIRALADIGIEEAGHVNDLIRNDHFKGLAKVDLLKSYYNNGYKYNLSHKLKKVAYYREFYEYSNFFIMSDVEDVELDLEIVHRFPHSSAGIIEFSLNGIIIGTADSGKTWSRDMISIPGHAMTRGLNTFTILWPLRDVSNHIANTTVSLENPKGLEKLYTQMYTIIGEIHSFQLNYKNSENNKQMQVSVTSDLSA